MITDYTSFDEVRAALGVSEEEIEDDTLSLPLYSNVLEVELEDIHVSLPGVYSVIAAKSTPTEDEARFLQAARLFATYAVAKHLTTALPLFSPEQITDGKAEFRRAQQGLPYQRVIEAVTREYNRFRGRLHQLFALINSSAGSTAPTKIYFGVVSPSEDPIAGGV